MEFNINGNNYFDKLIWTDQPAAKSYIFTFFGSRLLPSWKKIEKDYFHDVVIGYGGVRPLDLCVDGFLSMLRIIANFFVWTPPIYEA